MLVERGGLEWGKEKKEMDLQRECSEESQPCNYEANTFQEFNI